MKIHKFLVTLILQLGCQFWYCLFFTQSTIFSSGCCSDRLRCSSTPCFGLILQRIQFFKVTLPLFFTKSHTKCSILLLVRFLKISMECTSRMVQMQNIFQITIDYTYLTVTPWYMLSELRMANCSIAIDSYRHQDYKRKTRLEGHFSLSLERL